MWGHYARVFAQDVYDRIYAKALVVEDGGELAAIVEVARKILEIPRREASKHDMELAKSM